MASCPSCGGPLTRSASGPSEHWACAGCGGRPYTRGRMRTAFPAPFFNEVQAAARAGGWRGPRRCPHCPSRLVQVRVECGGSIYALDLCDHCRLVWFDRGEHEAARGLLPAPPPPVPAVDDPPAVRSRAAGIDAEGDAEIVEGLPSGAVPGLLALIGFPVPVDPGIGGRPWTTWILAFVMVVGSGIALVSGAEEVAEEWGLVAGLPFRNMGRDFLTSTFLHADFWHLLSNVYFLLAFGGAVEAALRPARYLLLAALAALGGDLLYLSLAGGSMVPSVGASGAIAGILAYGACAIPRARVRVTWLVWFTPWTGTFSARTALGIWVGFQVLGSLGQWMGATGIDHLAHLGGAAVGFCFWYFGPDGPRPAPVAGDTIRLSSRIRWEE